MVAIPCDDDCGGSCGYCLASELLGELDELRGKVATFERMANAGIARMIERANSLEGDDQLASAAMAQAVSTMLDEGRKLGLFEEPKP